MNSYRDDVRLAHKEARWTFFKFLPLFLLVVVILALVGFGLRSAGLIGSTVVERKVFEQSYQRSAGLKAQLAADNAALAEIETRLSSESLDQATRDLLQAQARAARIRIATTKEQMQ